jgi:hypothetical protein
MEKNTKPTFPQLFAKLYEKNIIDIIEGRKENMVNIHRRITRHHVQYSKVETGGGGGKVEEKKRVSLGNGGGGGGGHYSLVRREKEPNKLQIRRIMN